MKKYSTFYETWVFSTVFIRA